MGIGLRIFRYVVSHFSLFFLQNSRKIIFNLTNICIMGCECNVKKLETQCELPSPLFIRGLGFLENHKSGDQEFLVKMGGGRGCLQKGGHCFINERAKVKLLDDSSVSLESIKNLKFKTETFVKEKPRSTLTIIALQSGVRKSNISLDKENAKPVDSSIPGP